MKEIVQETRKTFSQNIQLFPKQIIPIKKDDFTSEEYVYLFYHNKETDLEIFQAFVRLYKHFLHTEGSFLLRNDPPVLNSFFNKYFQDIFELFTLVEHEGGYEEMTSKSEWPSLSKNTYFKELLQASNAKTLKDFYQIYLFHFEKTHSQKALRVNLENYRTNMVKLNPKLLNDIDIFTVEENPDFYNEIFLKNKHFSL